MKGHRRSSGLDDRVRKRGLSTPQSDQFFPRIEGLRGVAALVVVAQHAWQSPWRDTSGGTRSFIVSAADGVLGGWTTTVLATFGNGLAAVNLFFVISGFVLLQSLMRGPPSIPVNTARFVVARLFRIYPAAIATIGLFFLAFVTTGAHLSGPAYYSPMHLLQNALLIEVSINGVMWTLKLEVIAIPLFVLGYVIFRFGGVGGLVAMLAMLVILAKQKSWIDLVDTPFGLRLLPFFATGMVVFTIGKIATPKCSAPIAAAALILAFIGMFALAQTRIRLQTMLHIELICSAVIVGLLAFADVGAIGRFFEHPIVRFYGRVSYSFYLVNPLTLLVLWHIPDLLGSIVLGAGGFACVVALILFAVSVAVTTPAAWVIYEYVERPGVSFRKKFAADDRTAPRDRG